MDDWRPSISLALARLRASLLARARDYFAATGALEVDTPALVRSPVTDVHLESLAVHTHDGSPAGFLHTSPEYAMKRLLCAGWPDIYQIGHVFREGERGSRHSPEFTMIEWYRLGSDHLALMEDVEQLVRALLAGHVEPAASLHLSYGEAFGRSLGIDPLDCNPAHLREALQRAGVDTPAAIATDLDALLDLAMGTVVAEDFPTDRLTLLRDFPARQAALARTRGPVASRFEAFWGPLELANGFHELGDAGEQSRRFASDVAERQRRRRPTPEPDRLFLAALDHGLPECSGVALGFDRLVMLAAGASHIDEVLSFPPERA
jgi:lysyl-tRNA synthetase class 2